MVVLSGFRLPKGGRQPENGLAGWFQVETFAKALRQPETYNAMVAACRRKWRIQQNFAVWKNVGELPTPHRLWVLQKFQAASGDCPTAFAHPQNNQTAESASHFSRLLFREYKYND